MTLNSSATTRGLRIEAFPQFVPERSSVRESRWFFAYTIRMTNTSEEVMQLLSRHWIITNARGEEEEVKGPGVVGEQPILRPGESFEYTSACPLDTPVGTMHGTYQMITPQGETFDAVIAPFTLAEPYSLS